MAKTKRTKDDLEVLAAPIEEDSLFQPQSVDDLMNDAPEMDDPDWSDWVLGQFHPEEMNNGLPNVAGLRRVAQKLLGPIIRSVGKPTPQMNNALNDGASRYEFGDAVSVYEIDFIWRREDERHNRVVTYGDVGSCSKENCDNPMVAKFKPETATTRAEARCLRKALQLKAIAAEEQIGAVSQQPNNISSAMILFMDANCRKLNINVKSFVNAGKRRYNFINDVPYDTAMLMTETLGDYEREPSDIPKGLVGYKQDWRESFCQ